MMDHFVHTFIGKTLIGFAVLCFVGGSFIFGQATTPYDGVPVWVKDIGAVGILIWYVWFSQSVSLPRLAKDFREATAETNRTHKETIDKITDTFRVEVEAVRRDRQ